MVKPFFAQHCVSCHGEKKHKGDLRVDTLSTSFSTGIEVSRWTEIMDRINSGDMPPKEEPKPDAKDIDRVVEWIAAQLHEAEAAQHAKGSEKVVFRRLTREEYAHTIRDLLGVTYEVKGPQGLPEEPDWQGFERIGSVLSISPTHVEKYLQAASVVLDEAMVSGERPVSETVRWDPFDLRPKWGDRLRKAHTKWGDVDKVRVDIQPGNTSLSNIAGTLDLLIKRAGIYNVRIKLSGLRPKGGPAPRFQVYLADLDRVLLETDVDTAEDQPIILEFKAHLPAGAHRVGFNNMIPGAAMSPRISGDHMTFAFTGFDKRPPWQLKLTDDHYQAVVPMLLMDYVEWEGPVYETWPTVAYQRIFYGNENTAKDMNYARGILQKFMERAYRRPVQGNEVELIAKVVEKELKRGEAFENAVKLGLMSVLCSKDFLYLVEGSTANTATRLNDWELASRLSYFLWSTMPDDKLFDLARAGKLSQPDVLKAEAQRMLKDPKAKHFSDSFARQWLQLRNVGMFPPDKGLYPKYTDYLEKCMVNETTGFFQEVLQKNLSIRDFLKSDWTMLNDRLADHYGIKDVKGQEFRPVVLKPETQRGGLLTQAAILSQTSDGQRTRPVHRGKWVMETILGKTPPPPPANVGEIEAASANQPKRSLREKLEAHRNDAACAGCHQKIDPYGLTFENFDAVGAWRTVERINDGKGVSPTIDASGELPDGRKFSGPEQLKQLMAQDLDQFAIVFTQKLATYATRRSMTFSDRAELAQIAAKEKADGYKLQDMVESLILSDLFRKR
ncbi:MAG TPA: DUF1592 domain-containing protein [Verrucomicrobiae bacterium]